MAFDSPLQALSHARGCFLTDLATAQMAHQMKKSHFPGWLLNFPAQVCPYCAGIALSSVAFRVHSLSSPILYL